MELSKYCEIHLNDNNPPCFVADNNTDEILFLNTAMKEIVGYNNDVIGKKFHEVISSRIHGPLVREKAPWYYEEPQPIQIYSQEFDMRFFIKHVPFENSGITYNLCKYFPVESGDGFKVTFEEAMTRCVGILQHIDEEKDAISLFLELLGQYYDAEKTYFYNIDCVNREVICKDYWVNEESIEVVENLSDKIEMSVVFEWLEQRNEIGIIEEDTALMSFLPDTESGKVLESLGLNNIVLSVIENKDGQAMGLVVAVNRKESELDYRLIRVITKFVEQVITHTVMPGGIQEANDIDILTGLYRRPAYLKRIEELEDDKASSMGVVYVNVNGMKQVNQEYGYTRGDTRIKKSSVLLKEHFQCDFYRISGDEFVAFLSDVEKEEFEQLVLKLRFKVKNYEEDIFAIGHAFGSEKYKVLSLIQEAANRMYINKQDYYYHSHGSLDELRDRTLSDLLTYMKNGEFMIYLQPQVVLEDSSLYGAEALIRRFDKTNNKMVFPDQFIELYEKKSVIRHIDIFVVNQVCKILAEWIELGKRIPISVNLSRVTLLEYGIVDTIANICDSYHVPHELVVIEVTERIGLIENDVESSLVTEFKDKGFKISLDDFGCAYSNIVTLAQVSVDEVKIDKSLVDNVVTNRKNGIIVKNILSMCDELENTSTLSEGIETKEQADALLEYNCHLGQGYYYSRPIPVDEFYEKYIV